ncbi:MAG: class I SAM-dependent methyltransferase [Phycisphaeraceae bacterium]
MRPLWKRSLYKLFLAKDTRRALSQLKLLEYRLPSKAARFAVPMSFKGRRTFRSIKPLQTPQEIEGLYRMVVDLQPSRVLEIGTAKGGTLYLWCQAASDDATLVSADLPWGKFGGGYDEPRADLYNAFARDGQTLHLLRGNSHDASTRDEVRALFKSKPIDFAFIDGDHFYPGVKADFIEYGKMVRPGGLIAFHDICDATHDAEIEVSQLWDQIKNKLPTTEFVFTDNENRRLGIGVVTVPDGGLPSEVLDGLT